MLSLQNTTKFFIAVEPISFRSRIDGTAAACRNILKREPLSGALFIFINRRHTMVREYHFDGHGEWLIEKRVMVGKFRWWQTGLDQVHLDPALIDLLFRGGDASQTRLPKPWKKPFDKEDLEEV